MILFLIPGDFEYVHIKNLHEYFERKPFESDSQTHRVAREILHNGNDLHIGYYLTDEHLINHAVAFEKEAREYIREYAKRGGYALGPAYVMTKGLHADKISMLLNHMMKENTSSVLWLNSVIGADFTVNPYCLNKLE